MRIKKEHIGKIIIKGSDKIVLTDDMSEKQILWVKNMLNSDFVEENDEVIKMVENKEEELKPLPEEKKPRRKRK